ncbi:MAG TPA: hypothetical protein VNC50_17095, partial [Planctomycetia bacterium]|nr:hypothetical protein [Planctomycetia bacterium]
APTLAGDDPRLVDTVRLLRDADGVLAYVLGTAPSLKADVHCEAYLTVRRTDPARPVLALAEGEEARGWAGSVDGAILPTRASATRSAVEKTARRLALANWAMVDLAAKSPHRASLARIAAGASALIFRGEATRERLEKLNSGNLEVWRNLAVRGVERQDRIPGLHVWSRRAKDDVLGPIVGTILINESDKPWTGAPSYPGRTGDSVTIPPGELKAAADGGQIK